METIAEITSDTAIDLLLELAMDVIQVPHLPVGEMRFMNLLKECDEYADGKGELPGTITETFLQLSRLYFKYIDSQDECPIPHTELLILRNRMVRRELQIESEKQSADNDPA